MIISINIYLAGRYSRRTELAGHAELLETLGCRICCRWLWGDHELASVERAAQLSSSRSGDCARFASEDLDDLMRADTVIAFTELPKSGPSRGGRHVELGVAIGLGKRIVIVGPRENVFCHLPLIEVYPEWCDFLNAWFPVREAR